MSSIRALVVKIGAQTEDIDRALSKLGASVKSTAAELKAMDQTPIGQAAVRNFNEMRASIDGIRQSQERLAERARLAAVGLDQIGGAARLTKTELDAVNRTIQTGLDAYRALGQKAPQDLQRVADAVAKQKAALEGSTKQTSLFSQAQGLLTSKLLAFVGPAALGVAIKQTLDYADALTKASDQTKIGVVELQRINNVAQPSGNNFEQIADAVTKFQKSLASGGADEELRGLGLAVEKIRAAKGDEQFFAIARAIQAIEDPAEQARVAMELFGRGGAELLPTLRADIDGLKDSTLTMSAESVKALDDFGDQFGRLKTVAINVLGEIAAGAVTAVTEIAKLPGALKNLPDRSGQQIAAPNQLGNLGSLLSPDELKSLSAQQQADLFRSRLQGRSVPVPQVAQTLPTLPEIKAPKGDELASLTREVDRQLEKLNETNKAWIDYQRALEAVDKKIAEATRPVQRLTNEQQILVSQYRALGLSNQDIATKFNVSTTSVDAFTNELDDTVDRMAANREETGRMQKAIGELAVGYRTAEKTAIGFKGVMQATDPTLLQATSTTDKFNKHLLSFKDIGDRSTGTVDDLREAIEKDAAAAERARTTTADLAQAFAQLAQVSGGSFGGIVQDIGRVVTALDLAKKSAAAFKAEGASGTDRLTAAISAATAVASATGSGNTGSRVIGGAATGAQLGGIVPGIGHIAGGVIGGAVGLVRGLFGGGEKKKVDEIRQAWIDAAGGWDAINKAAHGAGVTLDQVLNARKVKDYENALKDLNDAIDFQSNAMATLEETTQKYGFTIDELGPAFQRQQLDKQAQTLFQDFSVLTGAGIDLNAVIARMGPSINEFAQAAVRTGQEVPAAMRPMIEKMIEMGLLTDENGHAFGSLEESGVTFSETMSQGFSRVVESVEKLTQAIARGLGIALDTVNTKIKNIPPVDVDVRFNVPDFQNPFSPGDIRAATGGLVTAMGIQHFGGGGRVLPFFRRGTDTVPAMLTPGEIILNQAQQAAVGGAIASGGGVAPQFKDVAATLQRIEVAMAQDRANMPKAIARHVRDAVQTVRVRR